MDFFDEMRKNNIHVMAIPPYTSHILQPLDSTPFAQFKRNWQNRLLDWNSANNAKILANSHFFEVFLPAWRESMTIPKAKYAPSQVTDSKNSCWLHKFIG